MPTYNFYGDTRGSQFSEQATMVHHWGGSAGLPPAVASGAAQLETALHEADLHRDPAIARDLVSLQQEVEATEPQKSRLMALVERITSTAGGVTAVANAAQAFKSAVDAW